MPIVLDMPKGKYPKFDQATEDIQVFKVVLVKNHKIKSLFYEDFWNPVFKMRRIGVFTPYPGKAKNRQYLVSNQGIYSFSTLRAAKRFKEVYQDAKQFLDSEIVIMTATIPMDSMYLKHNAQIISNQLWLEKSIEDD